MVRGSTPRHYKDLEAGIWIKVKDWETAKDAHKEIIESVEQFEKDERRALEEQKSQQ